MSPLRDVFDDLNARIARKTAEIGAEVDVAALGVSDRTEHLPLAPPGVVSPNGACRMVEAADGWIAVNLARDEDRDLIPAWLRGDIGEDAWRQIVRLAPERTRTSLVADATLLGLPVAAVGEVAADQMDSSSATLGPACHRAAGARLKVLDLSALWAGPMCGAILAAMGAEVTKVETRARPDPTRTATPAFFQRLNGRKRDITLDLSDPAQRAWIEVQVAAADVVISSARPRGLASLGLCPRDRLQGAPGGVWIAITGYGWSGPAGDRVAFGDDAAAAGGLVRWVEGKPEFIGDALADPLTGMAAALGALDALRRGGGRLVKPSLAGVAAGAAIRAGLARSA